MPFAAALSQHPLATHAVGEVVGQVLEQLGDAPDAVLLFVTSPFGGATEDIASAIRATLRPGALVGATASGVLGGAHEVEEGPAIALVAFRLPGAVAVQVEVARELDRWCLRGPVTAAEPGSTLVLLADPFSFPTEAITDDLAATAPGLTVIGGLASAGRGPGGNALVAGATVTDRGAVALLLPPGAPVQAIVSQGARPVGDPLVVTRSSGSLVEEIAGLPALDRLMGVVEGASPEDRSLLARGLHLGVAADEAKIDLDRDDFVVRQVLGAERSRGAIAVDLGIDVGSTIQFLGRDAETADEDLRLLLAGAGGAAAVAFSGLGRGRSLFAEPHHDAAILAEHVEGSAVAGIFCGAAIGPIGPRHVADAATLSVVVLEEPGHDIGVRGTVDGSGDGERG